ncbi:ABC transporter permease [Clostridium botulinum]|nr:ABC transporter permease [Clostridium botulinum]
MTFSSIMIKNFKFNLKKYLSYYLANSFIISVLLMYGSLIYSKEFINASETNALKGNFISILVLMVAFSIVFICYTTISFIRYRGKEFGIYLTLGVTTKDLRKILFFENILIIITSLLTGMVVGTLFSRIFYMIIGKILWIENFKPNLNVKMYLLCIAIALIIFSINSIFQMIFVRGLSIVELVKSSSTREIGKGRIIIGLISLILLIIALYLFPKIIKQEIFKDNNKAVIIVIITAIITPYFIIGSIMCLIDRLIKNFKKLYNNNILVLSSLQHKFISYKSVLYLVLILAAGAMVFIATAYSMYSLTEKSVNESYPYDVSFIENNKSNKISKEEIKSSVKENGGEIKEYKVLECLNLLDYRVYEGEVIPYGKSKKALISESNYNKHMGTNVSVNKGELIQVGNKEASNKFKDSDIIISFPNISKQDKQKSMKDKELEVKKFLSTMNKDEYIYIHKNKKRYINASYTNEGYILEYQRGTAFIINDEDYKKIKNKLGKYNISYDHLIMLKNLKNSKAFHAISNKLKKLNKDKKDLSIELRTLQFKQKNLEFDIKQNGFMLFSSLFLGMMFLISSGVVLYFKVLTNVDEEKERVKKLTQLGMTNSEVSKILTKELEIIFFIPAVLAVGVITYFFSVVFGIVNNGDYMFEKSLYVFITYVVLQIIFFFITRNKYIKDVVQ